MVHASLQAHTMIESLAPTVQILPVPAMRQTQTIEEIPPERCIPKPLPAMIKALQYLFVLANERDRKTGHWGVAIVIQVLISAYTEGRAGFLAQHVLEWQKKSGGIDVHTNKR